MSGVVIIKIWNEEEAKKKIFRTSLFLCRINTREKVREEKESYQCLLRRAEESSSPCLGIQTGQEPLADDPEDTAQGEVDGGHGH